MVRRCNKMGMDEKKERNENDDDHDDGEQQRSEERREREREREKNGYSFLSVFRFIIFFFRCGARVPILQF